MNRLQVFINEEAYFSDIMHDLDRIDTKEKARFANPEAIRIDRGVTNLIRSAVIDRDKRRRQIHETINAVRPDWAKEPYGE